MKNIKLLGVSIGLIIAGLLFGVAGWALYSLINQGMTDLLAIVGITNFYLVGSIIVVGAFIILLALGFSARKILKRLVG